MAGSRSGGLLVALLAALWSSAAAAALALIAAIILWLHRENIRRLMKGEEPKVGSKG